MKAAMVSVYLCLQFAVWRPFDVCMYVLTFGEASIRKVLQNCLVFKSIYLVDFPIKRVLLLLCTL